jgi:hypothetical protein
MRRFSLLLAACGAATSLVAGCGGSGSSNNSARIRAVNLVPNAGDATVYINTGSANGEQGFENSSSYLYLNGGSSTFTFSLASLSNLVETSFNVDLQDNTAYSAIVTGDGNVTNSTLATYPQLEVLTDGFSSPPSGESQVRIVDAAPDLPTVNVTLASVPIVTNLPYLGSLPTTVDGVVQTPVRSSGYIAAPSGNQNISVTSGGTTVVNQSVDLSSGKTYTIFITEPNVGPPQTYGVYQLDDDH